jgi:hypothetical protein
LSQCAPTRQPEGAAMTGEPSRLWAKSSLRSPRRPIGRSPGGRTGVLQPGARQPAWRQPCPRPPRRAPTSRNRATRHRRFTRRCSRTCREGAPVAPPLTGAPALSAASGLRRRAALRSSVSARAAVARSLRGATERAELASFAAVGSAPAVQRAVRQETNRGSPRLPFRPAPARSPYRRTTPPPPVSEG